MALPDDELPLKESWVTWAPFCAGGVVELVLGGWRRWSCSSACWWPLAGVCGVRTGWSLRMRDQYGADAQEQAKPDG